MDTIKNMLSTKNPHNIRGHCCCSLVSVFIIIALGLYYAACSFMTYALIYAAFPALDKTTGCPYTNPQCESNGCYQGHYAMCFFYGLLTMVAVPAATALLCGIICLVFLLLCWLCGAVKYVVAECVLSYRSAQEMKNSASNTTNTIIVSDINIDIDTTPTVNSVISMSNPIASNDVQLDPESSHSSESDCNPESSSGEKSDNMGIDLDSD